MAKDDRPENAGFIGRVVGDPANPPQTRLLTGWFGDAAAEGQRRLYLDPELSTYVDIPEDAILYTEAVRDSQPAGAFLVWIKADADVQQGGAGSRAGRFLQGQVTRDFSSPEKAGYRCVTQVPCAEPTGFTGQCTKQPEVGGGGWPCLTALPFCSAEPTGFTGKCTHQPWPNPTRYVGCTVLHCPTYDLTHQPHICQAVETGLPGCGGEPIPQPQPQEGGGAEAAGGPELTIVTFPPGCGYTEIWGLCKTHPIGCQPSVQIPCITITEMPRQCGGGFDLAAAEPQVGGPGGGVSAICATNIACNVTEICLNTRIAAVCRPSIFRCPPTSFEVRCPQTRFEARCLRTPICPVRTPACPVGTPFCPVTPGCPFDGFDPRRVQFPQQFGAAANAITQPGTEVFSTPDCPDTRIQRCSPDHNPSAVDACPTRFRCDTQPPTAFCTAGPQFCHTECGPHCQTPQPQCTFVNCTHAGPQCPEPTIGIACTALPPQCPQIDAAAAGGAVGAPGGGAHITLLTVPVWACAPTPATRCFICPPPKTQNWSCQQRTVQPWSCPSLGIACTVVKCPGGGGGGGGWQEPTPATVCFVCTQVPNICGAPEAAVGAAAAAPAGAAGGEAHITLLTVPVWACAPTPATRCFICPPRTYQWWQCPPRTFQPWQCPTLGIACTAIQCGGGAAVGAPGGGGGQEPTPATVCFICTQAPHLCGGAPEEAAFAAPQNTAATTCTQFGQQCLSAVDACPTRLCGTQATVCTQFGCGGGGGGHTAATVCTQFGHQCRSAVDACPTRLCRTQFGCAEEFAGAAAPGILPTDMGCPTQYWQRCCHTQQFECTMFCVTRPPRCPDVTTFGPRCNDPR